MLADVAEAVGRRLDAVFAFPPQASAAGPAFTEATARRFALAVGGLAAALPLLEQGAWSLSLGRGERSALAARRWVERIPALPDPASAREYLEANRSLSGLAD